MLLDIIMPKLDGLTVMDRVNQDKDLEKAGVHRDFCGQSGKK